MLRTIQKEIHHELPHMPPLVEMQQGAVMRSATLASFAHVQRQDENKYTVHTEFTL